MVAPSRLLAAVLVLALVQGLLAIWLCGAPWPLVLILTLVVCLYAARELRRLRDVAGVLSTRAGRWFWCPAGGEEMEFALRGELVLWPWLVVINGRIQNNGQARLVLARDSLQPDDWRRLQAALRYS